MEINSLLINQLIRKVQKGDEKAVDELHNLLDKITNENIELNKKFSVMKGVLESIKVS